MEEGESVKKNILLAATNSASLLKPSNRNEHVRKLQFVVTKWSSSSYSPELEKPAIVRSILFGKYEKTHVCNLRKFKIYGGLTENHMIELYDGGLKNDHVPETFLLRHEIEGNPFPCRYIKIEPLQAWGANFNFSIWYVELWGNDSWDDVKLCMNWYNTYREKEAIRLCLKHFRQRGYTEAFRELNARTSISLEHPLITQLHTILVINGDFKACEDFVIQARNEGMFDQFLCQQEYDSEWTALEPINAKRPDSTSDTRPGMRGGHQMCIDVLAETIYMFGGWDGNRDLADLWSYHLPSQTWVCLSQDTEKDGGPSARSCHKMCLDYEKKQIFTLGRYLDQNVRSPERLKCDFHMYDIESHQWTFITEDTAAMGGPRLIFDHQMVIDIENQTIYVFGGRVLTSPSSSENERAPEMLFSGLYSFHIPSNTWTLLIDDCPTLRSRIGHSMLFHPVRRVLYIFAGQRSKDYLNDFLSYHVDTKEVKVVSDGKSKDSCQAGFTQRATLDPELNEIYVFSGLSRDKEKRDNVKNSFWVYDIIHYLFGGNPGKESLPRLRLDDFWSLKLSRPSLDDLLRRCRCLIRKQQFLEMTTQEPLKAMSFLQNEVADMVDHTDPKETKEFQLLTSSLFPCPSFDDEEEPNSYNPVLQDMDPNFRNRTNLFNKLVAFFPDSMTQPKENLVDLVPLL
ncbi:muskelin [Elysia marginata]|uniref:Muskelin n=1 Tax=Elysia marginata TaxID=1093978 RepID=A0AAV4I6L9_9GAST|nr:muskelin [Elysia marginata]